MQEQFDALGLLVTFHEAVDGRSLGPEQYACVDREARRRLGLWPQADGSIANWLSHRQVMREMLDEAREMVAIFEDDAILSVDLPRILDALERKPFDFDVVMLNRRSRRKPFVPCESIAGGYVAGRLRYSDFGSEGYVITRDAARHFLAHMPQMMWEIDHSLSRFWENGLNVFYVDPPLVSHDEAVDSQIEAHRVRSRRRQRSSDGKAWVLWRRAVSGLDRKLRRRIAFSRLVRGEIGVTRWSKT